ncbi:MAG: HupE/UreJ family protein [Fimbriimonadaceae bacterium]|nr:HupE/UreJ family protein [Fimbriimonadaceae bacterium]
MRCRAAADLADGLRQTLLPQEGGGGGRRLLESCFACGVRIAFAILTLISFALLPAMAWGHPTTVCAAQAKVQPDGSFQLRVRFDVPAFALETPPADVDDDAMRVLLQGTDADLQRRLNEARDRFGQQLRVTGSGAATISPFSFPTAKEVVQAAVVDGNLRLPMMASVTLKGKLPAGSRTIAFRFPEALGTVILTVEFPYREPISEPVESGSESTRLRIPTQKEVDDLAASMGIRAGGNRSVGSSGISTPQPPPHQGSAADKEGESGVNRSVGSSGISTPQPPPHQGSAADKEGENGPHPRTSSPSGLLADSEGHGRDAHATPPGVSTPLPPPHQGSATDKEGESGGVTHIPWYRSFGSYVKLGFVHIIPAGLDHILFVLGLFLLSRKAKDLIKQITAFTIAHSLTLALSLFGVFQLPASVVEPLIALSIVFVAVENIFTTEMKSWRPYVVFGFGLMHGLGFAGILHDAQLPRGDYLSALIGFNAGVELGQLAVVAGAFLLVGWFRSHDKYRQLVTMPVSMAIALVAIFWTVQRIFF